MKLQLFSTILASILLMSCDVARVLIIDASKVDTSVSVYTKSNILPSYHSYTGDDSLVLIVPNSDEIPQSKVRLQYGFGGWPATEIDSLASKIDSIIIINKADKLLLNTNSAIESYLLKQRRGIFNNELMIKTK